MPTYQLLNLERTSTKNIFYDKVPFDANVAEKLFKWYLINTISGSLAFPWSIFDCLKVYWDLLTFWHQDYPGILGFKMTINFDMTHFST